MYNFKFIILVLIYLFSLFQQASLRTGGHQIRVRHGLPDPDFTVEHMLASHMDDNPIIPGITLLLRVLPHSNVIFLN